MTNIPADQPLGGGWETVGRCVNRALHDLEPERSRRLDGLVNIGIDETSYKKGHKYIAVIVNHDTNTVVWASEGHGKSVLEKFYFQTILCSTTLSVDELLAMGDEDAEAVLTHRLTASSLTVG